MASMISENESFQDGNGKPIVNGYIYVGVAGQDPKINPTPIYSDRNLTVPIANPQRTDAYGRSVTKIWVSDRYSLKVENVDGVQKLQDLERGEIASAQSINLINVQGINNVTADAVPAVDSYVDKAVYVLTVVSANTGAVTLDFGGGAKPVEKDNGDALVAGDWPAGSIQRVTYNAFSNRFDTLTFSTVEINNEITQIKEDLLKVLPIGWPFPVWNHIGAPPPSNGGAAKYIKLTAGEDGVGEYNEGFLTSESVTGSAPDLIATAVIDFTSSPMNGETVSLINTERRIVRPGESGTSQGDAIREITGDLAHRSLRNNVGYDVTGAFTYVGGYSSGVGDGASGSGSRFRFAASNVVPTADENRMKNIGATYYMRIA